MTTETDKILQERGETHGNIEDQSRLFMKIMETVSNSTSWRAESMSAVQAHSLTMMSVKISRILAGDPNFEDHWNDIIGYAQLALDHIRRSREK